MRYEIGHKLYPYRVQASVCEIIGIENAGDRKFYVVRYENGGTRKWSKSHLKKYYSHDKSKLHIYGKLNDY